MSDFLDPQELESLGFAECAADALISRKASILGARNIRIGRLSRIDAFCILSGGEGGLTVGRNVHIGAHSTLMGQGSIRVEDFAGVSVRCSIFSTNEDYSGGSLTNPTVPKQFRRLESGPVVLEAHSILGAGSVVLPNVTIGAGTAVGAMSLVRRNLPPGVIAFGSPARICGKRRTEYIDMEAAYLRQEAEGLDLP